MEPFLFFLAGIPTAFGLDRAIAALSRDEPEVADEGPDAEHGGSPERAGLPWQRQPWPRRLRVGIACLAPFAMALAGWRFGPLQAAAASVFLLALLVCTATDLTRFRVPNAITYPGALLALGAALVLPGGDAAGGLIAAAAAGGVFLVFAIITRGGLGLGDVKLAVLIGAALGFPGAYQALFFGIMTGGLVIAGLFVLGVVSRRQAVPYAPFLAIAAIVVVLTQGASFAPL